MIPAAFEYHRPTEMKDVHAILARHGEDARVMAGGHSLIPMMKLRMAEVPHVIDLRGVAGLSGIRVDGGTVMIGAMTTQAEIIGSAPLAEAAPILREAALQIADPQVRAMGTLGGNVANGDPGNDMPAVMICLDARFELEGPGGTRSVPAREFHKGMFDTARSDDEVLTSVSFDAPGGGQAYEKQKRKIGDYATAAAAVRTRRDGDACADAAVAMTNLGDRPIPSPAAAEALIGTSVDETALSAAVEAMLGDIDPAEDTRGSVAFKRHAAATALRRAIARAWSRTRGGNHA